MNLLEALKTFNNSVYSNEIIDRYVPYKDGIIFITKGEDEELDDDDYIIGDVVYYLVHSNGTVELTTPADCDFDENKIKELND